jgi:hypothetical protein
MPDSRWECLIRVVLFDTSFCITFTFVNRLRSRDGARLEYVDILPDDGWKHHAVHRRPAARCSRVYPRPSTRCSAQSQFVHRTFDSKPTWRPPPGRRGTGEVLLVPGGIGDLNFRPPSKSSFVQSKDGKFGAAKDHRKSSFGAGTPSLWCRWTDGPMPDDNADQQPGV